MAYAWQPEITSLDEILEAVVQAFPTLDQLEQRVGLLLYRLLAEGSPVASSAATQISKWSGMPADQFLARSNLSRLVEWDGKTVIGFGGLTTRHSRHSLLIGERRLSTWCAWDAMFVPGLLGVPAVVESVCPGSGDPIRLRVDSGSIERMDDRTPVLSFTIPSPTVQITTADQTILSFCSFVNLFESRQAGTTWISTRPGTFLLSLADGFALAQRYNASRYGAALDGEPSPPHGMPGTEVA